MMLVSRKDMILLLQGALTLLGSASHTITQERRWVAWSQISPSIGALPEDKDENLNKVKETTLFGGGFLERATKRNRRLLRSWPEQAMDLHKCQQTQDPHDLRCFLEKDTPARYGGRNYKRQKPYPSSRRGERSRRANSQPNSCEGTIDSCTQLHNFLINVFSLSLVHRSFQRQVTSRCVSTNYIRSIGDSSSEGIQARVDLSSISGNPHQGFWEPGATSPWIKRFRSP